MTDEARSWRRLAVAGAAAAGLLTWRVRVLTSNIPLARRARNFCSGDPFWSRDIGADDAPFSVSTETGAQRAARRLGALEEHLADLEERIGPVVSWFGDDRPCRQRR